MLLQEGIEHTQRRECRKKRDLDLMVTIEPVATTDIYQVGT